MYKYYGPGRHMAFRHQLGTKPIGKRLLLLPEPRPGPSAEPKIICHPEETPNTYPCQPYPPDRGMYKYYGPGRHMAFRHQLGTKPIGKRLLLLPEPRPGPSAEPKIICHPEAGNTKYIPLSGERARVRVIPPPPKACPSIDRLRMILRRAQDVRERPNSAGFGLW